MFGRRYTGDIRVNGEAVTITANNSYSQRLLGAETLRIPLRSISDVGLARSAASAEGQILIHHGDRVTAFPFPLNQSDAMMQMVEAIQANLRELQPHPSEATEPVPAPGRRDTATQPRSRVARNSPSARRPSPLAGFAVIDVETTGFSPAKHDRIVEVAVVHTDEYGNQQGVWETLVNPQRDLGPQHIHKISAREAAQAPTFAQVAPKLVELLAGRVLVAHNASFDLRFLEAELERCGYSLDRTALPQLCTMQAAREFLPDSGRSLRDCCATIDVEIGDAHRASADAIATAKLLQHYISAYPDAAFWEELVAAAADHPWPPLALVDAEWVARQDVAALGNQGLLQRVSERMPSHPGPRQQSEYLALVDRCLLDRRITVHEADALVELAQSLGLDRDLCADLHGTYFDSFVEVAWSDGVLTAEEREDITAFGALLEIPAAKVAEALTNRNREQVAASTRLAALNGFRLAPGDVVALTGEMQQSRPEWEARLTDLGLTAAPAITKKVKVLAAADPDSFSGKAKKARDYGIPIIDEPTLERLTAALA